MKTVSVKVLFFAQAREISGKSQAVLAGLPEEIRVIDLLDKICNTFKLHSIRDSVILSVDEQYCSELEDLVTLKDNSEVAVIPPISGG